MTPLRLAIVLASAAIAATGCVTMGSPGASAFSEDGFQTHKATARDSSSAGPKKGQAARGKPNKSPAKTKTATAATEAPQGAGPVDEDLWQRIRQGLKIEAPDHPRLEAARRWLDSHPQYLARLAENAEPFIYLVTEQVEQRDMPLELALLPVIESAYNPAATSRKNAAGIWQFMPGTARVMGLKQDSWYDGRRDVVASTDAALGYLKYLSDKFDGDWHLALAAYNAGEGTIRRAIERNARRGKPTDYWSLDLPTETERYVPKLLAVSEAIAKAEDNEASLPVIKNEPKLAAIEVSTQIDISTTSQNCDVSESALRAYNPALRRGTTSPDGPHRILLPVDEAHSCHSTLVASVAPNEQRGWTRHLGFRGEALAQAPSRQAEDPFAAFSPAIAEVQPESPPGGATPDAAAGPQALTAELGPGLTAERIEETQHPKLVAEEITERRRSSRAEQRDAPRSSPRTANLVKVNAEPKAPSPRQHRVRGGETLYSIARQYKVEVDDLKRWNKLRGDRVVDGQSLAVHQEGPRRL